MVLKILSHEVTTFVSYIKVKLKQSGVMSYPHIGEQCFLVSGYCFELEKDAKQKICTCNMALVKFSCLEMHSHEKKLGAKKWQ